MESSQKRLLFYYIFYYILYMFVEVRRRGRVSNVPRSRLKLHLWIPPDDFTPSNSARALTSLLSAIQPQHKMPGIGDFSLIPGIFLLSTDVSPRSTKDGNKHTDAHLTQPRATGLKASHRCSAWSFSLLRGAMSIYGWRLTFENSRWSCAALVSPSPSSSRILEKNRP